MTSEGRRLALIVASSQFDDPDLHRLGAPDQDAADLARVLGNPTIGKFKVEMLINRPSHEVCEKIEVFFTDCQQTDLLLLYYSGHGVTGNDDRLYLATSNTQRRLLHSRSVPATFINDVMTNSASRRQVLILDCCYSGAFARGMVAKGDESEELKRYFEGRGRVVLTASSAIQPAFEGNEVTGPGKRSIFTQYLVQGLETGAADLNGDGWIEVSELYQYVQKQVAGDVPHQTPRMWVFDLQGKIFIARNRLKEQESAIRDDETREALLRIVRDNHWVRLYMPKVRLDVGRLPNISAGALSEYIARQVIEQDSRRLAGEHGQTPSTEELCRLLSRLGWYMFSENVTACKAKDAAQVIEEALAEIYGDQYDAGQVLNWLASTYWFRKTSGGEYEFRDPDTVNVFAAMELKEWFSRVLDLGVLGLGPGGDPAKWQQAIAFLAGMLMQDQVIELVGVLLQAGLVQLAGWCVAEGQPMPRFIVEDVIHALLALSARGVRL